MVCTRCTLSLDLILKSVCYSCSFRENAPLLGFPLFRQVAFTILASNSWINQHNFTNLGEKCWDSYVAQRTKKLTRGNLRRVVKPTTSDRGHVCTSYQDDVQTLKSSGIKKIAGHKPAGMTELECVLLQSNAIKQKPRPHPGKKVALVEKVAVSGGSTVVQDLYCWPLLFGKSCPIKRWKLVLCEMI